VSDAIPIRVLEREAALQPGRIPERVDEFLSLLGAPTLISVKGRDTSRTRIAATLLHGNEPSGLRAVHAWLRTGQVPAVNTLLFIAAVRTALAPPGFVHRFLPGRIDLNRLWFPPFDGRAGEFAHEVLRLLRQSNAESLVDLHNNTGHNPPYGVGPEPGAAELNLVAFFAERFVHSPLQLGTLVEATRDDFPSVSIECGRSGSPEADAVALAGLERYFAAEHLETRRLTVKRMQVFTDPVRVSVRPGLELAFGDGPVAGADFTIARDIDRHNFERVGPGAPIGWLGADAVWPVEALGEERRDLSRELFAVRDGVIETQKSIVPIMMTTNRRNALDDCLFYTVERAEEIESGGGGTGASDAGAVPARAKSPLSIRE
jgi:hypothetical protein